MYRNVFFNRKKSIITHWSWEEDGTPTEKEVYFRPYLYVPSTDKKKFDATGIDGIPLVKREFDYEWERQKFVKSNKGTLYFNLPPTQQYLLENYYTSDIADLTRFPLRTFFFDIEVIANEFPKADEAKFPITSITIYDSKTKKYYVWGIKKYDDYSCKEDLVGIEPDEIVYSFCMNERDLMTKFLKFWRKNFPDLIVGFNSYSFDIPYIVNRLNTLFGEDASAKLSPVDNIYGSEKINKFQQRYIEYTIGGIAHIDYMVLYKTFTPGERESDGLDHLCYSELGVGKLEFGDMSLQELYRDEWNKFINYNIWDVKLLVDLDAKKKYLDIAKFSAFSGFCNLDKAFGKTAIITGILAKQSLERGLIIPTQSDGAKEDIPGGYVKVPAPGLQRAVISFDANSLYPSNIITLNISPETKVAKITKKEGTNISMYLFREKKNIVIDKSDFAVMIREKNWSLAPNGVMYDQTTKSISSEFCDTLYNKRKKVKDEMLDIEKQLNVLPKTSQEYKQLKLISSQKDVEQYLYKILLNSTYGAFANRFFSLYDADCARSITLSGQAMIKKTEQIINDYLVSEWELDVKDRVVGMDTDSVILTIGDICDKLNISLTDSNGDLIPEFVEIETKISKHLNLEIQRWAKEKMNSSDPRYFFKRESVCPKALWTGKKHYILYLVNKEGKKMDEFKYSGLQIAKSSFSKAMKDTSKEIVKIIMSNNDKKTADDLFFKAYEKFSQFPIIDISERGGIKVLSKWEGKNDGLITASGTTRGAKYSIYHNELIKELGLQGKYRKIENGSKIKMLYIKDNKYNLEGIAYQETLPPEFEFEPDYERMFYKAIVKSLEPIYNAMGWNIPDPNKQYETTLEELFG